MPLIYRHISCHFRSFGDITEKAGTAGHSAEGDIVFPLCSLNVLRANKKTPIGVGVSDQ